MKQIIPIMFCFDKNYVIPAAVATYSLLENNRKRAEELDIEFRMYVVHTNISIRDQEKLKSNIHEFRHFSSLSFIDGGEIFDETWKKIRSKNHFSKEMFFKLITPSLFPQYEKIIISDVDVVFLGDVIEEFISFNTSDHYLIGGVVSNRPEDFFPIPKKGYRKIYTGLPNHILRAIQYGIGGGYLIVNIKRWKEFKTEDKALEVLKKYANKLALPEQDALSIACWPQIKKIHPAHIVLHTAWEIYGEKLEKMIPNIYTKTEIYKMCHSPIQLHYAGANKPWNTSNVPKSELWFKYLCKTSFLDIFLNYFEQEIKNRATKKSIRHKIKTLLSIPLLMIDKISNFLR